MDNIIRIAHLAIFRIDMEIIHLHPSKRISITLANITVLFGSVM
jgi:hypothetical protein